MHFVQYNQLFIYYVLEPHALQVLSNIHQTIDLLSTFNLLCIKTQYQSVWCQIDAHDVLGTTVLSIMVIDGNH